MCTSGKILDKNVVALKQLRKLKKNEKTDT